MTIKFEVMTKTGSHSIECDLSKEVEVIDGIEVRRQIAQVRLDDVEVDAYSRIKLGDSWLPWVDVDWTHTAKSLRDVAEFWAN
jgi:hypothetical protein